MRLQIPEYQQSITVTPANERTVQNHANVVKAKQRNDGAPIFRPEDYVSSKEFGIEVLTAMKHLKKLRDIEPTLERPTSKQQEREDAWPDESVRKVPRSMMRVTGRNWNNRTSRSEKWESRIEGDYLTLLEFDPKVDYYLTQPTCLEWKDSTGKRHSYTPDCFVAFKPDENGVRTPALLIEFKHSDELKKKHLELEPKFEAARELAEARGWQFLVLTEKDLPKARLENFKKLHRPAMEKGNREQMVLAKKLIATLFKRQSCTVEKLMASLPKAEQSHGLFVIWMLVVRREFECDLDSPLTMQTEVWLAPTFIEEVLITSTLMPTKRGGSHGK